MKTALITGITGQDGSYLSELLLSKGYDVHGIIRRASTFPTERIDHLMGNKRFHLHYGDMTDGSTLRHVMNRVMPDEIYNLAAQSHVAVSFESPEFTANTVFTGTLRLLEAYRDICPTARFYQASTSEMFGNSPPPQSEDTPLSPRSPYAVAKVAAHQLCRLYRDAYGLSISCGILFNHEGPRRLPTFVTRKVTLAAARIATGTQQCVELGNLDSWRDWGHAQDYVYGMWLMLQHEPDDFVLATGMSYTVRDLCREAFLCAGIRLEFEGKGVDEIGIDTATGIVRVKVNRRYYRPAEVEALKGDARKARKVLGWKPEASFEDLIQEMVNHDLKAARREA